MYEKSPEVQVPKHRQRSRHKRTLQDPRQRHDRQKLDRLALARMGGGGTGLKDAIGRHQDREVQIAMLRSLADEVAGLPRGPQAVLAMGVLIERLRADELAARHEFEERFALLAASERHDQVKATFG